MIERRRRRRDRRDPARSPRLAVGWGVGRGEVGTPHRRLAARTAPRDLGARAGKIGVQRERFLGEPDLALGLGGALALEARDGGGLGRAQVLQALPARELPQRFVAEEAVQLDPVPTDGFEKAGDGGRLRDQLDENGGRPAPAIELGALLETRGHLVPSLLEAFSGKNELEARLSAAQHPAPTATVPRTRPPPSTPDSQVSPISHTTIPIRLRRTGPPTNAWSPDTFGMNLSPDRSFPIEARRREVDLPRGIR